MCLYLELKLEKIKMKYLAYKSMCRIVREEAHGLGLNNFVDVRLFMQENGNKIPKVGIFYKLNWVILAFKLRKLSL